MALELSDETIDKIVDGLITKGHDFSKSESEKELRNTKQLLKNYRLLENHANVEIPTLKDDVPLSKYELSLYSLLGYRARSKEMIQFINRILSEYKRVCLSGTYEQQRRYDVISNLYINDQLLTRTKLAEKFNVDEKTIYRDERRAVEDLSIMIFGIDSFNDLSK
ncbi:hypothetical protein OXT66_07980 [Lentilactobacillus senioris]|uniref:HTH domain-containing protein n=1 Tax=Lentilactobacillus senioris TaxID=931534 RepID=UPI0022815C42|nr:HTH domain-containing protein [Lentilactobacillus senioris]MCY9807471.1 hypothetical protein [Lentilactobacillus senioris]